MMVPTPVLTSYELSAREAEVLLRLTCYRFLSRSQIEEFLFDGSPVGRQSKPVIAGRVLRRLKSRGLISATPRLIGGPDGGSARIAYFVSPVGHKLARALNPGLPARRPALRGTFFMRHGLMTAEIALVFRRAARSHPGHELIEWECDWEAAERYGASAVVPDAHVVYRTPSVELDAFIEVDLGTEGTRRFARKVSRYLRLFRSGTWRGHLSVWPLVLTVAISQARVTALRRATERVLLSEPDAERIAKATEFDFCSLPDLLGATGPLGEIWQMAGRRGLFPLLEAREAGNAPA